MDNISDFSFYLNYQKDGKTIHCSKKQAGVVINDKIWIVLNNILFSLTEDQDF